ncbi:MAG: hypothetical protein ABIH11_05325 [Candidatus Altiarchaeota archaeon]
MKGYSKKIIVSLLLILSLTAASCCFIYSNITSLRIPFDNDEAEKAVAGLRLYQSIKHGSLGDFISATIDSGGRLYPFIHSWLLSFLYLINGPDLFTSRLQSLLMFGLSVPLLFAIGLSMDVDRGWFIGLMSCLLMLTSKGILLSSALCMIESTGIFMSLCAFALYFNALRTRALFWYLSTGFFTVLTFLTKYNYGIFIIAALMISHFSHLTLKKDHDNNSLWRRQLACLLIPMVLCVLWVFVYWDGFYRFLTTQPVRTTMFSAKNIFYYPKALYTEYSPSPVVFFILIFSLLVSLKVLHNQQTFFLTSYVLVVFISMVLKLQNESRFIITAVPALYLLAGLQTSRLIFHRNEGLRNTSILLVFLAFFSMLHGAYMIYGGYNGLLRVNYEGRESYYEMHEFISSLITEKKHVSLLCAWDQMPENAFKWFWAVNKGWDVQSISVGNVCENDPIEPYYVVIFEGYYDSKNIPEGFKIMSRQDFEDISVTVMGANN